MHLHKNHVTTYEKNTVVSHPSMNWGYGLIIKNNEQNRTVNVNFEKVGIKTISLQHVVLNKENKKISTQQLRNNLEKAIVYSDKPFIDIFNDIKSSYPFHLVIIENGCYYEILKQDAEYFSKIYGWTIYERQIGVPMTGFPEDAKKVWTYLESNKIPYIIVSQLPKGVSKKVRRSISTIFQ